MSLYFEDFTPGTEFVSRGRTVTEADLVMFAGLTGDITSLHLDAVKAAGTPFGQRIAHGAFVFSCAVGLMTQTIDTNDSFIAFYGVDKLRFTAPTFIGDTIHVEKKVLAAELKEPGRGIVTFETRVVNQRGELAQIYTNKILVKTRSK